ncbi:MAG: extracellular solute-binding protein [Lachnospiraceae bacterium]|nr:extracellular solute-binding protein [Lachnospiraceae bacterium]
MFQKKKWVIGGLLLTLAIGLAACGGKKGAASEAVQSGSSSSDELVPEYSYVAEYVSFKGEDNFGYGYSDCMMQDAIYTIRYGQSAEEAGCSIKKWNLQDGSIGEAQTIVALAEGEDAECITVDEEGYIYAVIRKVNVSEEGNFDYESQADFFVRKYSGDGQLIYDESINAFAQGQQYFYVNRIVTDAEHRVYLLMEEDIFLLDANGQQAGKIESSGQGWIMSAVCGKDGKVYVIKQVYDDTMVTKLLELNFEGKKVEKTYEHMISSTGCAALPAGSDKDFLVSDGMALYEYSLETQEAEKLLTWIDCDIEGNSVQTCMLDKDGRIIVYITDYEAGESELAILKKVKTEELAQKETLVVGTLYQDSDISKKIVDFNKQNDKYRLKLKVYLNTDDWQDSTYNDAVTAMNNDIISGNGPDLFVMDYIDTKEYGRKGVFEDLMPYLEKSTVISKDDFFEKILDVATYDGKLYYIADGFYLNTLVGRSSMVGDNVGWTVNDMMKLAQKYPKAQMLEYATKSSALSTLMSLNKQHFLDVETGACHFDSEEFRQCLEFANTFPATFEEADADGRLTPTRLADGSLLLTTAYISSFDDVQSTLAYFDGDKATFIGYPTYDGGNGCMLYTSGKYGISAASKHKDGAWAFIESVLAGASDADRFYYRFSSRKSVFEEQKKEALDVKYVYDENGEILKDENGDPVYEQGMGGFTMLGDDGETWDYTYRPITQEEVDLVLQLLDGAVCADYNMDTELQKIIDEEASAYFEGAKSLDETVSILQNRASLYLKESR